MKVWELVAKLEGADPEAEVVIQDGEVSHLLDRAVVEGTGYDGVHPAIHIPGYILERLSSSDAAFAEHRVSAGLLDGKLESDSRP